MPRVVLEDDKKVLEVLTQELLLSGDPRVVGLNHLLNVFHVAVPLTSFEFEQSAAQPSLYHYQFEARDARLWRQDMVFSPGDEPAMNFAGVVDFWRLKEFSHHRGIRDLIVELQQVFGATNIECRWR